MKNDFFPTKKDTKPKAEFPGSYDKSGLPSEESIKPEKEFGVSKKK